MTPSRLLAALWCFVASAFAHAQHWPVKPVIFVSTGASDAAPRIVGEELSRALGQQIVIDTHAGASGIVSAEYTLRQPPDGYTFLTATSALMAAPHTFKISFDVVRDFTPVSLLATAPFVLVAHPALPVKSLARGLAASAPKRSMVLPDVPTFTELRFPDVALPAWYGILARAGTPAPVVSRLSAEIARAVGKSEVRERLLNAAVEPVANTPEQYAAFIASDLAKWGEAAKAAELNLKTGARK